MGSIMILLATHMNSVIEGQDLGTRSNQRIPKIQALSLKVLQKTQFHIQQMTSKENINTKIGIIITFHSKIPTTS